MIKLLATEGDLTIWGVVIGVVVSVGTLIATLKGTRTDALAVTLKGSIDLSDRYRSLADDLDEDVANLKGEIGVMKGRLDQLSEDLAECTTRHKAAERELMELRQLHQAAVQDLHEGG